MAIEYRVEKQSQSDDSWQLAYRDADGYSSRGLAELRMLDLQTYTLRPGTKLRVVQREVSDWEPVPDLLREAIERVEAAMKARGEGVFPTIISYQNGIAVGVNEGYPLYADDVKLLLEAVRKVQP